MWDKLLNSLHDCDTNHRNILVTSIRSQRNSLLHANYPHRIVNPTINIGRFVFTIFYCHWEYWHINRILYHKKSIQKWNKKYNHYNVSKRQFCSLNIKDYYYKLLMLLVHSSSLSNYFPFLLKFFKLWMAHNPRS